MDKRILIFLLSMMGFFLCACSPAMDQQAQTEAPSTASPASDCVIVPPEEPRICTMEWDPVCGCDGKTYGNACAAAGAGVPHHTPGECEKRTD